MWRGLKHDWTEHAATGAATRPSKPVDDTWAYGPPSMGPRPMHDRGPGKPDAAPPTPAAAAPAAAAPAAPTAPSGFGPGQPLTSSEGYESVTKSALNPQLGRRVLSQAMSALAAVRSPY